MKIFAILALHLLVLQQIYCQERAKPNVIVLFADDAGYADFGFNGSSTMITPNLDQLASEGVKCTQGYVSDPTCGPSRAGILTGKYQQRFGFTENNVPGYMSAVTAADGEDMGIPVEEETIGDYMKKQDYKTMYIGKWHVGGADKFHPTKRGFDEFYGFRGGARAYTAYKGKVRDPLNKMERNFEEYKEPDGYVTDVFADEAVKFIEKNKKEPFFVFLSFNAVHTPMEAKKEDLAKFPELKGKRKIQAAMMLAMDRACGKVLDKVKELGLDDNTIVIFTNDNGGPTDKNASSNYPYSGTKSNHLEGGIRVPFLVKWPEKIKPYTKYDKPVSTLDILPLVYAAAGGDVDQVMDIDGVDILPFLQGQKLHSPHHRLYWKKQARAALREGDFKLIRYPDRPAELYNIAKDPRELNNLADLYPERVRKMYKAIFQWESTLERPRWLLKREFENVDIDRMDEYRDQSKFFQEERIRP